ncbi:efflux RND transporter periplasmic adaptor subunit [Alteromonas macleodii]|uniref:Efflux transporter, RND family, MFP subunit n=1 Tax=Alteromonas macleodii TaxID=28108 RepID=A0AB36FMJ7_ALTMA|nr:efflux RND transporter periplasmic adaptor subunit [Alteromonas macleodii]OES24442.1 efflux transporter, RND family, MFP subunit [Alteromonas macleodii]OES25499.1 efflux transporter, RND family, MFP subunit [Alteromonas macleodii]OES25801.1 efflux transporter, RND family, MFP subunit [Alteromonas macleodii]OES38679.1 efflux transporter, RND family, MFP subunit [Alteromonas macleodii]
MTEENRNPLKKEYLLGFIGLLSLMIIAIAAMFVDWSSVKNMLGTSDVNVSRHQFIDAGPFQVAVSVQPETPQVGKNRIVIIVHDKEGNAVKNAKVRAVGEMPAMGSMPAMYAQADITETSPGVYEGDFELSMAGSWPLAVDVATDEAHHVDLTFDMATSRKGIQLSSSTPSGDVAYHTCSMHPSVKSATPGTCPICGMDLVPVTKEELKSGSVTIDEGRRQKIGVKTDQVVRAPFTLPIDLQGEVTYDETRLTDISLRFDGWIGKLNADFEGRVVKQGEILFTVYSPELLSLQEEYLETFKRSKQSTAKNQRDALIAAGRKRLHLWGLSTEQIKWLETQGQAQDYVPIFAGRQGVILQKNIVSGSAFRRGEKLLRMADLSVLWIEAFAYEQQLPLIKSGMNASIRLSNIPGREFSAEVMQVDPFLGKNTRTARVRLKVDNPDGELQPGIFANVTLKANLGSLLLVPEDAVLIAGKKRIVFVDLGEGRLKPKVVKTGYSNGEYMVIRSGLDENDTIVTSGNFLVAAESKLKSGVDQW